MDWDIWVGILPPAAGGQAAAVAVNDYLDDRNHAWRTGCEKPPREFLEVSEFFTSSDPAESAARLGDLPTVCAVGDLDHANNFLTAVLYAPGSEVVVAKGTTNNSGGMGNNANGFFGHNIATAMAAGASMGQAILGHVNVPLIEPWLASREFQLATSILLGNPSLRLRE